ncbi:MAG: hypothetical protein JWO78_1939 [Micavibrio sp.]|nr:hypothetical protein [Micavibrio sp.]
MTANAGQVLKLSQRFARRIKPAILTFAVTATALLGAMSAAQAQPATCDPKYWDSLKAKAWTEAEREIEQNQNYIYKADSVLQYTCFDQFVGVLGAQAANMFSQTTRWGAINGPNMTQALQNLVGTSLQTYLANNFKDNYLGDFSSQKYAATGGGNYNCSEMAKVWVAAKCQDIANASTANNKANTSTNTDFFYLSTYNGTEYRQYPASAVCTAAQGWAATYATAMNTDDHYPKEKYDPYLNFFKPTSCTGGAAGTALPATIPTGVQVKRRTGGGGNMSDYPEIICVAPGCASNAQGTACE